MIKRKTDNFTILIVKYILIPLIPIWLCVQQSLAASIVDTVLINGKPATSVNDTILLKSSDNLAILFSAIPDTSAYFYQLQNQDASIASTKKSFVFYSGLRKGTYDFYACFGPEGANPTGESEFALIVESSFLHNWQFAPLLALYLFLLFGGASYFIILINLRNKKKLAELRSDWANKLHNDIGGDLSGLSLRLDSLKRKLATEQAVKEKVIKTYDILKSIQKKLRFVFDLVDPNKNSLHIMLADVLDFAQENYDIKQIEFIYSNTLDTAMEYKIDIGRVNKLYLVMKEAVNNCMKHSEATQASIHINRIKGGLLVEMKDNGKGFDTTVPYAGNGVDNLRRYSREGLMDITISSKPGQGASITIFAPDI